MATLSLKVFLSRLFSNRWLYYYFKSSIFSSFSGSTGVIAYFEVRSKI